MIIKGKWLDRVDGDNATHFIDMYNMTPDALIVAYQLERIKVPSNVKLIAFPCEYSKDKLQQLFVIEPHDEVYCWSEGCHGTVFNTSGIAIMELERHGDVIARWSLENSPYEMDEDDLEEIEFNMSVLPEGIVREDMIFVQQL